MVIINANSVKPRKKKTMKLRGDRIRKLREDLGLSQLELSKRIGVSVKQVGRYETDKAEPTAHVLANIAKELHCSADYLLNLVDAPAAYVPDVSAEGKDLLRRLYKLPKDVQDFITGFIFRK